MATCMDEEKLVKIECIAPHSERKSELSTSFRTFFVKVECVANLKQDNGSSGMFHLQAVLFDEKYGTFVGSCWTGKPVHSEYSQVTFNQVFYFYTSLPVEDLLLVIELITPSKVPDRFKTCGWIGVPLIEEKESISDDKNSTHYKVPLIFGSPIALIATFEDVKKKAKKKKKKKETKLEDNTTGMEISLSRTHCPQLLKISNFVPENILLDSTHHIPGVALNSLQAPSNKMLFFKPQLLPCITFVLENFCIKTSPSRIGVEDEIVEKFISYLDYAAEASKSSPGSPGKTVLSTKVKIVQRRLQVGVHNGYCFIQEPDIYHLHAHPSTPPAHTEALRRSVSTGTLNSNKDGLIMQSDIKLKVPDDPNIAIVFLLEYIITLPSIEEQSLSSSWSKSPTANISIAWGFNYLQDLKENPYHHLVMTCNPKYSPHTIFFLRTEGDFIMTFSAISLLKQNKDIGPSFIDEPQHSVISTSNESDTSNITNVLTNLGLSVPKHKSIADIPMTVQQNETGSSKRENPSVGFQKNDQSLALQEVTLVSSSLPLVPPLLHSFPLEPGESFKIFTKVYWDQLPTILDHHGKPAFSIDSAVPYRINSNLELSSSPQISECMLQLLAVSRLDDHVEIPDEIFATFQFYRFLPIRSESLRLKPLSDNTEDVFPKSLLVYALHKTRGSDKFPGFQVTYSIDPSELNGGEYKQFLKYLMTQNLLIDLWNGSSLLYFGTVSVPLKYFCRQGKEAVFSDMELEIFNCEFLDESLGQDNTPLKTTFGKLHIRLASIRHPLSSDALEKVCGNSPNCDSIIISSKKDKQTADSCLLVSKARRIAETDRELSKLLSTRCVINKSQNMTPDPHVTEERRRKLARMEAVRNLENNTNSAVYDSGTEMHFFKEKQRDWLSIESYIAKNKSEFIQTFLHSSITLDKTLYPVAGRIEFFEFVIENPYQEAKKVEIIWKCSELSLVTDNKLWQLYRNFHNLSQKVHNLVFADTNQDQPTLLLQPREKIHVPFVYQNFANQTSQLDLFKAVSGHHFSVDVLSSMPVLNSLESCIKVKFITEEQTLLAVLNLKIQPLPPAFTHSFKFLSMEHSMFKKCIQIANENGIQKVSVACSHSEVVCTIPEPQESEENLNVHIKAPTKSAGKNVEFCVFIYKEKNPMVPVQTWKIIINPLQRVDLSCIAGQLIRSSLLIRGTHATNLVRCCSSSKELQLHPSDPFVLSPFAVQELSMNIRCLMPGIKHFQINMVNEALELTLQSWLLVLSCQKPSVSKAFQVHLIVGKESAKRISYTNPYSCDRRLVLRPSHPHLLRLRESRFSVGPGLTQCIGLYFVPQEKPFPPQTTFLYLNDASDDKNEETYCIKILCKTQ